MALLSTYEPSRRDCLSVSFDTPRLTSEGEHSSKSYFSPPAADDLLHRLAITNSVPDDDDHKILVRLPPGFRFQPLPRELAYHLLPKVLQGCPNIAAPVCHVADIFLHHPVQLSDVPVSSTAMPMPLPDNFFFVTSAPKSVEQLHSFHSAMGALPVRFAAGGSWRAIGHPSVVIDSQERHAQQEAVVTTYRFYTEGTEEKLTDWRVDEYSSNRRNPGQPRRTLCHLRKCSPSASKRPLPRSSEGNEPKRSKLAATANRSASQTLDGKEVQTSALTRKAGVRMVQNRVCASSSDTIHLLPPLHYAGGSG